MADTDISADGRKNTADRDGRITVCGHQDMGEHGGCGCLSVGTGNGDRSIIVAHDLSEQLSTGQHRNAGSFGGGKFRVVRMNGCRIDNEIGSGKNIFGFLTVENLCAKRSQVTGQIALLCIRAGNSKVFF